MKYYYDEQNKVVKIDKPKLPKYMHDTLCTVHGSSVEDVHLKGKLIVEALNKLK